MRIAASLTFAFLALFFFVASVAMIVTGFITRDSHLAINGGITLVNACTIGFCAGMTAR